MSSLVERDRSTQSGGTCPECSGDFRTTDGETVCVECGLVTNDLDVDYGPISPYKEGHHGLPRTAARHDRGLGTYSLGSRDASGNRVESARLSRMRREQNRARFDSRADQNLAHVLGEVKRIATALGRQKPTVERASVILRRAQAQNLFKGKALEAVAAAGLVAAVRIDGDPFSADDVGPYARVDVDRVWNAYITLNRELQLPTPPPSIASHVPRLASKLGLPDQDRADSIDLARKVDESAVLTGHSPRGAAGTCIYAVTGHWNRFTQEEIAQAAGVSTETIYNDYGKLKAHGLIDDYERGGSS